MLISLGESKINHVNQWSSASLVCVVAHVIIIKGTTKAIQTYNHKLVDSYNDGIKTYITFVIPNRTIKYKNIGNAPYFIFSDDIKLYTVLPIPLIHFPAPHTLDLNVERNPILLYCKKLNYCCII